MELTMPLALLLLALILFVLAALNVPARGYNLTAIGLACWVLSLLWPR